MTKPTSKRRPERAAYDAARYRANKGTILARQREYRAANHELIASRAKARRLADPEREAAIKRKSRTGFTADLYWRTMAQQDFLCGICGDNLLSLDGFHVHADHCHETGAPRGILCGPCNRAIGLLRDDPVRLRAAAAYLESPPVGALK